LHSAPTSATNADGTPVTGMADVMTTSEREAWEREQEERGWADKWRAYWCFWNFIWGMFRDVEPRQPRSTIRATPRRWLFFATRPERRTVRRHGLRFKGQGT